MNNNTIVADCHRGTIQHVTSHNTIVADCHRGTIQHVTSHMQGSCASSGPCECFTPLEELDPVPEITYIGALINNERS